jgi:two-component system KDP operon response regulator KdpE
MQEEIRTLLTRPLPPGPTPVAAPLFQFPEVGTTARRPGTARADARRRVLLIDDDEAAAKDAHAALSESEFVVQAVRDGNAALAAIAADRPDAIVIDLDLGGPTPGKDLINMVRATMEWVDIPLLLYTRVPIAGHEEARALHGGDDFVSKSAGPAALTAAVTTLLQQQGR